MLMVGGEIEAEQLLLLSDDVGRVADDLQVPGVVAIAADAACIPT